MTENKKITVLQIGSYFLGTRLFSILHKKLNENGIESFTYSPCSSSTFRGWKMEKKDYENVVVSECFTQLDRFFFFRKARKIFKDIEKHFDVKKMSCIYAHSVFSAGYPALKLKKKYGVPYVVSVCNSDVNTFFKYILPLRPLGRKVLKNAEIIIFVTDAYRDFTADNYIPEKHRKNFLSKCVTVPFGIDDFWIKNRCEKDVCDRKNITLVSTGRTEPNKNQITTVNACEHLIKKGYNVKLKLIGAVTDDNYYRTVTDNSFTEYLGVKTYEEMKEIYKSCDIFVLPSIHETFGLVYGEAMSCGLPVIYSRGQGFDRQFENGTVGFAVDSKNPGDIANVAEKIINNYEAISKNAFNMSLRFDWNSIVKEYTDVFENI